MSAEHLVLAGYAACMVLILVFSLGQWHLWLIRRGTPTPPPPEPAVLPPVTIQLPVYNERYVIRRLIECVAAIDYPRELLEIQVLDDSSDETSALAGQAVARLQAAGVDIQHVRRVERSGYKAGALQHGLACARGSLIAVFDADFLPRRDFLRRAVPYFADPRVGGVQTRWTYLNERDSLLTRVQAFLLGLHFHMEQGARCRNGLFLNFNGTGGVLRKAAIVDAGGWSADTLTEDIDLSYRAQLRGWRLVFLEDSDCPNELPADMSGLRSQQYRWMKGGAQNARRHLLPVLRSGLPGIVRYHAAQHLLAGSIYVVILSALLLSVPLAALKNTSIQTDYVDYGLPFITSTLVLFVVFRDTCRPAPQGLAGHLRFIGAMLVFLAFTMGLALHNGGAVISGWLGRRSAFVRTAKFGAAGWQATAYAGRRIDRRVLADLLMLAYLTAGLAIGVWRGEFALFPMQLMACCGLVWVIALSVTHPLRARRHGGPPAPSTPRTEHPTKELAS